MANKAALEIDIVTTAKVDAFDDVSASAADMAGKVDSASRSIDTSASRIDRAADASDNLASKSSQATGGLGALASGMELVGAEKYGIALQTAALATDFFSGVGDIANLVLNSQAAEFIKAKAATIGHTIATGAQTAATTAQTVAQKALNLAMKANPIGLVITAAALLVAGFVLLYKKSETFREGVQKAGKVGKAALGFVVDRGEDLIDLFGDVLGWVESKIPGGFGTLKNLAVRYMDLVLLPWRTLFRLAGDVREGIGKVPEVIGDLKDKVVSVGGVILSPFRELRDFISDVIGYVDDLLDKLDDLKDKASFDIPGIDLLRTAGRPGAGAAYVASAGGDTVNIRLEGFVTDDVVEKLIKALSDFYRRRGLKIKLVAA